MSQIHLSPVGLNLIRFLLLCFSNKNSWLSQSTALSHLDFQSLLCLTKTAWKLVADDYCDGQNHGLSPSFSWLILDSVTGSQLFLWFWAEPSGRQDCACCCLWVKQTGKAPQKRVVWLIWCAIWPNLAPSTNLSSAQEITAKPLVWGFHPDCPSSCSPGHSLVHLTTLLNDRKWTAQRFMFGNSLVALAVCVSGNASCKFCLSCLQLTVIFGFNRVMTLEQFQES